MLDMFAFLFYCLVTDFSDDDAGQLSIVVSIVIFDLCYSSMTVGRERRVLCTLVIVLVFLPSLTISFAMAITVEWTKDLSDTAYVAVSSSTR